MLFLWSSSCQLGVYASDQLLRSTPWGHLFLLPYSYKPNRNPWQSLLCSNPPASPQSFQSEGQRQSLLWSTGTLICQPRLIPTPTFISLTLSHYLPYWPASATLVSLLFIEYSRLPLPLGPCISHFLCLEHAHFNLLPSPSYLHGLFPYSLHDYRNESPHWDFPRPTLFKMDSHVPESFAFQTLSALLFSKAFYYPLTCCVIYLFSLLIFPY